MSKLEKKPIVPMSILIIYAHEDEIYLESLQKVLSPLMRQNIISACYVREINAETDPISNHLATAPIILVLISPDFLASDYYQRNEMKRLFERHKANEARVLPVLLRPVEWERTPFAMLEAFPGNKKPVTTWRRHYEAFADVIGSIRRVIGQWDGNQFPPSKEAPLFFDKAAGEEAGRAPEVCCVYTNADKVLQRELLKHLEVLRLQGVVSNCCVREINTESERTDNDLTDSSIILVLISPDFLASDYHHSNEMEWLFERHEANEVRVLPVLLRPVDWEGTPFALLQNIFNNEKPITAWHNRDEAFLNVVKGILEVIGQWDGHQFSPLKEAPPLYTKVVEEKAVQAPEVFCVYADADEALQRGLSKHFEILLNQGIISTYYVRKIDTETDRVSSRLATASIILALISPDFLASDYRHSNEMKRILERREANEARLVPIILRRVDLRGTPFGILQPLPRDGKPISSWGRRDEAFVMLQKVLDM